MRGTHHDPVGPEEVRLVTALLGLEVLGCFLTRFLTQDEFGSTRRMDGGRAFSKAGLILDQRSCGSRVSRRGKDAREAARS